MKANLASHNLYILSCRRSKLQTSSRQASDARLQSFVKCGGRPWIVSFYDDSCVDRSEELSAIITGTCSNMHLAANYTHSIVGVTLNMYVTELHQVCLYLDRELESHVYLTLDSSTHCYSHDRLYNYGKRRGERHKREHSHL